MPDPHATADDFIYTLLLVFLVYLFWKIRDAIKRGSPNEVQLNDTVEAKAEKTETKAEKTFKEESKSVEPAEKVNETDSTTTLRHQPSPKQITEPEIVTRTGKNLTGKPLFDRFFGIEREFTKVEDNLLLKNYRKGLGIVAIANLMQIDQKQIAIRLIRLLINPKGPMDDQQSASENGQNYRLGEKEMIEKEFSEGIPIEQIANMHNRTVLAIGWQLIENPNKPLLT